MIRQSVSANRTWEGTFGYSRAVRVGNVIEVSGTCASDANGHIAHPYDVYNQARQCFLEIGEALNSLGGSFKDVVRTRLFMTDVTKWEEAGRAHGEIFSDIRPVCTTLQIAALIDPRLVIEIEVSALIESPA